MYYEDVFRELNKRKIRYLVIGGIAVNLHGFSRTTGDLDLMISFDDDNVQRFIEMVQFMGLKPKVPVPIELFAQSEQRARWVKEKNMKVFSVYNPKKEMEHIDVMTESYINFEKAYKNRVIISAGKLKIMIVSIPDLIRLKKIAGRERDKIDIQALNVITELKNEKAKRKSNQ